MKITSNITVWRADIGAFEENVDEQEFYKYQETSLTPKGDILYQQVFNPRDEMVEEYINTYNNEQLIRAESKHLQEGTSESDEYTYDENGKLVEELQYFDDALTYRTTFAYNEAGHKIEVCKYYEDGELMERDEYEPNDKGSPIRHTHYDGAENKEWETVTTYNEAGEVLEQKLENINENQNSKLVYAYNEQGKKIRTEAFENGKLTTLILEDYDAEGRPFHEIRQTHSPYTRKLSKNIVYDDAGRIQEEILFDELNNFMSSREAFEYDEDGRVCLHEYYEYNVGRGEPKTHFLLKYEREFYEAEKLVKE